MKDLHVGSLLKYFQELGMFPRPQARILGLNTFRTHGRQGHIHVSHHLLPPRVPITSNLELEVETGSGALMYDAEFASGILITVPNASFIKKNLCCIYIYIWGRVVSSIPAQCGFYLHFPNWLIILNNISICLLSIQICLGISVSSNYLSYISSSMQ